MELLLARLKRRLNLTEAAKDNLLGDLLQDAQAYIKGYTGRTALPQALDGVIVELAAGSYNLLGLEGASSASMGGVSGTYEGLPKHLQKVLDMYRVAKVGGA
ncbi:MAG: phage head-tail connector protein [Candidatus Limiplasma sp.]|nr:phage head-tail connector protein [Candidatus Limiplasma sp.]